MFNALRSTFSPIRVLENFEARRGDSKATLIYVISLVVRGIWLPGYLCLTGIAALIGLAIASGTFDATEVFPVAQTALLIASIGLPMTLIMLLCMRNSISAAVYVVGIPGALVLAGDLTGNLANPSSMFWYGLALHVMFVWPFYLLAEEGLSGKRVGLLSLLPGSALKSSKTPLIDDHIETDLASVDVTKNHGYEL